MIDLHRVASRPAAEVLLERLRAEIERSGGQWQELARLARIRPEQLSRWHTEALVPNPKLDTLERLARAMRIPLGMLVSDEPSRGEALPREWEGYDWLSVEGEVGAGPGRDWDYAPDEGERVPFRKADLETWGGVTRVRLVKVALGRYGRSMVPTIQPGSRLLVQAGGVEDIEPGRIYVVWLQDEGAVVKRLFRGGETGLIAWSDNAALAQRSQPVLMLEGAPSPVRGVVRWIGHMEE